MRKCTFLISVVLVTAVVAPTPAVALELLFAVDRGMQYYANSGTSDWDFDGDGKPEVVLGDTYHRPEPLEVYDAAGTLLWSYTLQTSDVCPDCNPGSSLLWNLARFADVDPAPGREAVLTYQGSAGSGVAVVSSTSGQILANIHHRPDYSGWTNLAAIGDFGGGTLEEILVAVGNGPRMEVWGVPMPSGADGAPDPLRPAIRVGSPSARPTVSFSLTTLDHALAIVFAANGRAVRTLFDGRLPAGDHSLPWDGLDDAGQPAPAGVYFVRVETAEGVQSAKVVLAR